MYTIYISHSTSPWELAQVYALAKAIQPQDFEVLFPDRDWDLSGALPESVQKWVNNSDLVLVFATANGSHGDWINRELDAARNKPVIALIQQGIELNGPESERIVRFDSSTDVSRMTEQIASVMKGIEGQNRNRNLVSGLLIVGAILLLLRGSQGSQQ